MTDKVKLGYRLILRAYPLGEPNDAVARKKLC